MKNAIEAAVSAEEKQIIIQKILPILEKQTRIYTGGDSSSVKSETAKSLLNSLLYVLGADEELSDPICKRLIDADIDVEFQKGLKRIESKTKCAKELYRRVCENMPEIVNASMRETVLSIGSFWKSYDYRLFAAEIPCSIDYQLALPVSEKLKGVDYLTAYLEHLYSENRFINFFDSQKAVTVLKKFCGDYQGLLVNIFEPLAANSAALEILGKDPAELYIAENDREKLELLFFDMAKNEISVLLKNAAKRIAAKQGITAEKYTAYLCIYMEELSERVFRLKDKGGLEGIFP